MTENRDAPTALPTPSVAPPKPEAKELGKQAVAGVFWVGSGQFIRLAMSFLTNVLLTRMLLPSEVGVFGMAYVAAELAQLITAFGVGSAIVQRQVGHASVLSSCFWVNIAIGCAAGAALILSGPLAESYFATAGIAQLMPFFALNAIVCAAMVIPQALLTQRLSFRYQAQAQVIGSLVSATAALSAAALGAGLWALVIQPLVGNLVTALLMFRFAAWTPTRHFSVADVRPLIHFSSHLLVSSWLDWVTRSLPNLVIGRVLGAAAVGVYGVASGLTGPIVFQVTSVITRVLFPTIAALKDDPPRLQQAWLRACTGVALVAWPMLTISAAVASSMVPLLFGSRWEAAIGPFQILAIGMTAQSVGSTANSVTLGLGRADLLNMQNLVSIALVFLALWLGSRYGLDAACIGYASSRFALVALSFRIACQVSGVKTRLLVRELFPWGAAAAFSGAGVLMATQASSALPPLAQLLMGGLLGPALYVGFIAIFARRRALVIAKDLWSPLRKEQSS